MTRAYVSSTFADLEKCREAAQQALRTLRIDCIAMEGYVADDRRPLELCLEDVAQCDLYIGIFAWRYGYIPPGQDDPALSITELEYREAQRRGIPCLIFLQDEDRPWRRSWMDRGDIATRIETFREELSRRHTCSFFGDDTDLLSVITAAVAVWQQHSGQPPRPAGWLGRAQLDRYRALVLQRYGGLDLDPLTPPQADDDLAVKLTSVFVEQHVRADPPPPELPREWLERLRDRGEIFPEDVPDPVDPAELASLRESYQAKPLRRLFDAIAVPDSSAVVLLGDPGSGKSTVARFLVLTLASVAGDERLASLGDHLPVLVELRSYAAFADDDRRGGNMMDFLDRHTSDELGLEEGAMERYLDDGGPALVVFDGLDEVFDQRRRAAIANEIAAFTARFPSARVIVTSRIIGYSRRVFTDAGFVHFTLQDLDEDQIGAFLAGWYRLAMADRAIDAAAGRGRILQAMAESAALRELAGNPLLLTILAIIGRHQVLPRDRWTLYDHATTVLVEHWDVNRQLGRDRDRPDFIDAADKKALLRGLALRMQSDARSLAANYIEEQDLTTVFEDYLRDRYQMHPVDAKAAALKLIDQFRVRNFILSRYGGHLYGFVHRTFLEFFCADAIVAKFKHEQQWKYKDVQRHYEEHWADPSWREVLRLVAGSLHEAHSAKLISLLAEKVNTSWPPSGFVQPPWNLALAVQCLGEVRRLRSEVRTPAEALLKKIILLLEYAVDRNDPDLAALIGEEIVPAARAIGPNWPGREVYQLWYRRRGVRLRGSPTMGFAAQLAAILSRPDEQIEELFDGVLARIEDNRASYAAVLGLIELAGAHPSGRAVRAMLIRRASDDPYAGVRIAAVQALGERFAADDELLTVLITHAGSGAAAVRQAAVRALSERYLGSAEARDRIAISALKDPHAAVRRDAVHALSSRSPAGDDLERMLRDRLAADSDPEVVAMAAQALLDRFGRAAEVRDTLIIRSGADEAAPVRRACIRLLGERWAGVPRIADLLVTAIRTESSARVLAEAARCFGTPLLPGDRARVREGLRERLREEHEGIRLVALQALADQFGDDPAIRADVLERARSDHDASVRLAAVTALARWATGYPDGRQALRALIRDDADRAVRAAALDGLVAAERARPEWNTVIRPALAEVARHDPEPQLRARTIEIMAEGDGVWGNLTLLAERCERDESPEVRLAATGMLAGASRHEPARRTLIGRVRGDVSSRVFGRAAEAVEDWLSSADEAPAVLAERAVGERTPPRVRRAAAELLGRLYGDDPTVLGVLVGIVRDDPDSDVLRTAAEQVACSAAAGDQRETLKLRANSDGPATRGAALCVLGEWYGDDPEVLSLLLRSASGDTDVQIRRQVLSILGEHLTDRPGVWTLFVECLRDPDWSVRQVAMQVLGEHFGAEESTFRLIAGVAAGGGDPELTRLAGQTLSWLPGADPDRLPDIGQ